MKKMADRSLQSVEGPRLSQPPPVPVPRFAQAGVQSPSNRPPLAPRPSVPPRIGLEKPNGDGEDGLAGARNLPHPPSIPPPSPSLSLAPPTSVIGRRPSTGIKPALPPRPAFANRPPPPPPGTFRATDEGKEESQNKTPKHLPSESHTEEATFIDPALLRKPVLSAAMNGSSANSGGGILGREASSLMRAPKPPKPVPHARADNGDSLSFSHFLSLFLSYSLSLSVHLYLSFFLSPSLSFFLSHFPTFSLSISLSLTLSLYVYECISDSVEAYVLLGR